jgi:hypothetical protein
MTILLTSIPVKTVREVGGTDVGEAWQAACIGSWLEAGFKVISLNAAAEIARLHPRFPDVSFREIPKGYTRPLIDHFIDEATSAHSDVVGIINADCLMVQKLKLVEKLKNLNGLVVAERLNLGRDTLRLDMQMKGFDVFFFRVKDLAKIVRDEHYQIGDLWWDYWLPLAFHIAGIDVRTFPLPIVIHLNHEQTWDLDTIENTFSVIGKFLLLNQCHLQMVTPEMLSDPDIYRKTDAIYHWISSRRPLWTPRSNLLSNILHTINKINKPAPTRYLGIVGHVLFLRRMLKMFGRRKMLLMSGLGR